MERAAPLLAEAGEEFGEVLGFRYGAVDPYMIDDADYVLVTAGAMSSNVRYAVKVLRERGIKVGMLRLVVFRPFPFQEVRRYLGGRAKVAVLDRNMSPGHSGIFAQEVRAALSLAAPPTDVYGYVLGIGGRDIRVETVIEVVEDLLAREEPERCLYVGVKGLPIGPARPGVAIHPLEPLEPEAAR
jgi:pyruvate/2-oxoacid:ferredoxin oxidoreductase alpha subunit